MLTEQEIAEAKESKRISDIIRQVITTLPEEQWIVTLKQQLPNVDMLTIRETIMIQCGGDVH